jgi:hypothetical protein
MHAKAVSMCGEQRDGRLGATAEWPAKFCRSWATTHAPFDCLVVDTTSFSHERFSHEM